MKKIFTVFLVLSFSLAVVAGYGCAKKHEEQAGGKPDHEVKKTEAKQQYTCPMHPQIVSDKPGDCPICGMKLVPLRKEDGTPAAGTQDPADLSTVNISAKTAAVMGITYETVHYRNMTKDIRTSAVIVPNESRQYKVTSRISGWVEKLYVNQTGQFVKKGAPLLSVYSQELFAAQQEFLATIKAEERTGDAGMKETMKRLRDASRERLKLLDLSEDQISEMERTGRPQRTVILYSPATGYVMEKSVTAGQRIMMNESLMSVTDLSAVWGEADIYQPDLPYVKVGTPVKVTLAYWPGKVFNGRVSFLYPFLNPETRTLKARIEIENKGLLLKPQMFADAEFSYGTGRKLVVPETAVIRTGSKEYVFVKAEADHLQPVLVKTGMRSGDGYYEVLSGLKPDQEVVSSANFLVDSESSIKAALRAATQQAAPSGIPSPSKAEEKKPAADPHAGHRK